MEQYLALLQNYTTEDHIIAWLIEIIIIGIFSLCMGFLFSYLAGVFGKNQRKWFIIGFLLGIPGFLVFIWFSFWWSKKVHNFFRV